MIRLENLEAHEPEGLREEAQIELEQLANQLQAAGFEAELAGLEESVHGHLQHSAEQHVVEALNLVLDHGLDAAAALAIEEVLWRWARRRRRFRDQDGARPCAYIWGSDGEILKVVELPEPTQEQLGQE
jgi:hypothetical protein